MAKKRASRKKAGTYDYIAEDLRPLAAEIKTLTPDPNNARRHDDANLAAIQSSLVQFGQRTPIVVNRDGNVILKGNGTYEAARRAGWSHLAVVFVEDDHSTATGYALADNRTGELAAWDASMLEASLESLKDLDIDLDGLGFSDSEIQDLIDSALVNDGTKDEKSGGKKSGSKSQAGSDDEELPDKWEILIDCTDEKQQLELLESLNEKGYECRAFTA